MCGFKKQKKALTFYSQSLICHCNALVLLSFIILPYKTSALQDGYIVFETTHLSEYGIIATNTNSTPGNSEDNSNKNADKKTKAENDKSTSKATGTKSTSPKTGSEGMLILLFAIFLISGGTVTELLILSGKKRVKNRK